MPFPAKNKPSVYPDNKKIIILDTFYDYFAANLARRKLKLRGIESFLEEDPSANINSFGGILLKVAATDLEKAFSILSG